MSNQSYETLRRASEKLDATKRALEQSLESKRQYNAKIRSVIKGGQNVRNQNN